MIRATAPSRRAAGPKTARPAAKAVSKYYAADPTALVATGPGLPAWSWRSIELRWRGPVLRGETMRLILIPPWANMLLGWLRVVLLAARLACLFDQGPRLARLLSRRAATTAAILLSLAAAGTPGASSSTSTRSSAPWT